MTHVVKVSVALFFIQAMINCYKSQLTFTRERQFTFIKVTVAFVKVNMHVIFVRMAAHDISKKMIVCMHFPVQHPTNPNPNPHERPTHRDDGGLVLVCRAFVRASRS